jgi:acyl carrier protein
MTPTQSWTRIAELYEKNTAIDASMKASPEALAAAISRAASQIMHITPSDTTPLRDYGLDSLIAVELAATIEAESGIITSAIELISGASVASLVQKAV